MNSARPPSAPDLDSDLEDRIRALADAMLAARPGRAYREAMALLERPLVAHVLRAYRGNQLRAAQALGLNRNTLRKRCRALGLPLPRHERLQTVAVSSASGA